MVTPVGWGLDHKFIIWVRGVWCKIVDFVEGRNKSLDYDVAAPRSIKHPCPFRIDFDPQLNSSADSSKNEHVKTITTMPPKFNLNAKASAYLKTIL